MRPRCTLRNLTFLGINMNESLQGPAGLEGVQLALVDPGLHPDLPEGGLGLGEAVVDVGPQGVEGELAVEVPLGAGDLRPVQAAGDPDLDPAGAEAKGRVHRLPHGAAEGGPLFE